ncbi:hypothetical protein PsorP6_000434 [Peronosclerospora sorghi]|uniref:Uncharacterized protein n=1 Tax=Peronosclerospora sorghi TaxID=230839 RepID=A0ACC0WS03_9STRA|nr:hypothetical protein PsorP6_000434 [Peronosclerospora sorghi]
MRTVLGVIFVANGYLVAENSIMTNSLYSRYKSTSTTQFFSTDLRKDGQGNISTVGYKDRVFSVDITVRHSVKNSKEALKKEEEIDFREEAVDMFKQFLAKSATSG